MRSPAAKRLARLESMAAPPKPMPWHALIVEPGEDAERAMTAATAAGEAAPGDNFVLWCVVDPPAPVEDSRNAP